MLVKPEHVEIMLDVFSGMPNPSWAVPVKRIAGILEKIQKLPAAERISRDKLGYRGFVISNPGQIEEVPEKVVAFRGVIGITRSGKTTYSKDTAGIEEDLQKMAREMGYGDVLAHYLRPVK